MRDRNGLKAEDRRTIGVRHDPELLPGYPMRIGGELAAAPTYVDLEGRHQLDLVFATTDGAVYALRPDGREVPGFPVWSDTERRIDPLNPENYPARAYREPLLRNVREPLSGIAVGDLFHDGRLEIVATSANADVYAWDVQGRRLPDSRSSPIRVTGRCRCPPRRRRHLTGACPRAATGRRRCWPISRETAASTS